MHRLNQPKISQIKLFELWLNHLKEEIIIKPDLLMEEPLVSGMSWSRSFAGILLRPSCWFWIPTVSQSCFVWKLGEEIGDLAREYAGWGTISRLFLFLQYDKLKFRIYEDNATNKIRKHPWHTETATRVTLWKGDCAGKLASDISAYSGVIWYWDSFSFSCAEQILCEAHSALGSKFLPNLFLQYRWT